MRFPPLPFPVALRFERGRFERILQQLRDGRPGESAYGRREALLLAIPASKDPTAWDVRRTSLGDAYVVRTIWRRSLDIPVVAWRVQSADLGPEVAAAVDFERPTLASDRLGIDSKGLGDLLEALGSAFLPCTPPCGRRAAGATAFELTLGDGPNESRFRWSGVPPRGWAPLADFASGLLRLVDQSLSHSTPHPSP